MSEWKTTGEIPAMHDDDGMLVSGPLLVYMADKGTIAFGECRQRSGKPYFRASGYLGDWNITHWMPLPPPPNKER